MEGKIITNIAGITIILAIIAIFAMHSIRSTIKYNEIQQYKTIVINNQEYSTSEIVDVDYSYYAAEEDIKITLSDGTLIYATNYTLKDKK